MISRRQHASGPKLDAGVHLAPGVRETIRQHTALHHGRVVGGVLVGSTASLRLHVATVIPAFAATGPAAELAVSADNWRAVLRELQRHPQDRIVGWYRSQWDERRVPTAADRSIHRRYFSSPEQVSLIFEPDTGRELWFYSERGDLVSLGGRRPRGAPPASPRRHHAALSLWSQRAACTLAGTLLGAVLWLGLIRSSPPLAHRAKAPPEATAAPVAHPIVVEPQAGVQAGTGR